MNKQTGIYQITNTVNGWIYIGSSRDMIARLRVHISSLRHNRHNNSKLQADANKYGSSVFICSIIETLPSSSTNEHITAREKYYTDKAHKYGKCYNPISPIERPSRDRKCLVCGRSMFYSKNMCWTHYQHWKKQIKKEHRYIQPEEYIQWRNQYKEG